MIMSHFSAINGQNKWHNGHTHSFFVVFFESVELFFLFFSLSFAHRYFVRLPLKALEKKTSSPLTRSKQRILLKLRKMFLIVTKHILETFCLTTNNMIRYSLFYYFFSLLKFAFTMPTATPFCNSTGFFTSSWLL